MLRRARGMRRVVGLGVAFPASVYLATTLGFVSSYSAHLYQSGHFTGQYENNVYRYRVVGRHLLLGVAKVLDRLGIVVTTPGSGKGDLFTAHLVLNGAAFLGLALLLYRLTVGEDRWVPAYLVAVTAVAVSGYVVTPYDFLSYLLTAGLVLAAVGPRPWPAAGCAALALVAVATRESAFVGVAAAAAAALATGPPASVRDGGSPAGRRWRNAVAAAGGGVLAYAVLRVALAEPSEPSFFQRVPPGFNLPMRTAVALAIAVGAGYALHVAFPRLVGAPGAWWGRARRWLWVLSVPYLVASVVGGLWFEAPRLAMPLLLCEVVLRWLAAGEGAQARA